MKQIQPKERINTELSIPGSKSYANRALVIAALAKGTTTLANLPSCDDTKYMLEAIKLLGAKVEEVSKTEVNVTSPEKLSYNGEINVGGAGTAMRFLTSLCSLGVGDVILSGNERMCERPIEDLVRALETNVDGTIIAKNKTENGERCPPLQIDSFGLKGGTIKLKGTTSSQYLTSILLSAPKAKDEVTVEIVGELSSKPFVDMTIDIMKTFGVNVKNNNYESFLVPKASYLAKEYFVESDSSGVSYFLAAAAITGGKIKINNINPDSAQGDIHFIEVLEKMGCKIEKGENYLQIESDGELKGIEVDMNAMVDTAQTLAVLASVAKGKTKITNVGSLKVKETDRITAIKNELEKCGITVEAGEDYLVIEGGKPTPAQIETYDDHRMAMSFAVLGLTVPGIKIENPTCVSKSFPEFWELFDSL
ncbi:MAG: 3-phosphoshikimate 1-carboxyvinyltransferase [Candidatus Diapherotrites archaeon]|nr:3-phosphoshikimate 1-carboxyvinyltransferase [Candidatus Diapherotrites archaeon]MBT4596358.1 3-phosphoshikimate 1-carboxyvinyltransferase [Candidatus Diapherotrites archaeon]